MVAPHGAAAMAPDARGLQLEALHCERGARVLFSGLSAALQPGQLLRVQGANGAGKTSLLRMICGLLPPTRGRVLWQGQGVVALREEFGRQLVYLGHAAALKAELSPLENLHAAAQLGGVAPEQAAMLAALRQAGLDRHERAPVRVLSQGQRRRAALARLLLADRAPLWVLDEPFNALDVAATAWLIGVLEQHLARAGMVVLTSHQGVALSPALPQVTVAL